MRIVEGAEGRERYLRNEIPVLIRRDVVVADGVEASRFLHALLSQDVAAMAVREARWTFLLQPQGRVVALARVVRASVERFVLDTDPGTGEALHASLSRYLLRTKCALTLSSDVMVERWHGQRDGGVPVHRTLPGVFDVFDGESVAESADASIAEGERIAAGLPRHGAEIDASTIPNATGMLDDAVAFGKGCYVGQELVERIDSRQGSTPTRLVRFSVETERSDHPMDVPIELDHGCVITSIGIDPVTARIVALGRASRNTESGTVATSADGSIRAEVLGSEEAVGAPAAQPRPAAASASVMRASARHAVAGVVAFISVIAFIAFTAGCGGSGVEVALPTVPTTVQLRQFTTTTEGVDRSAMVIEKLLPAPDARPTTSVVPFGKGTVTIRGVVEGPDGPVPGATVRIERVLRNATARRDLVTDAEGRYELRRVTGGRVRLRAWRVPDHAGTEEFVGFANGTFTTTLSVRKFGDMTVRWGIAPSPPIDGRAANVVVQVTMAMVDADGIVRPSPIAGVGVLLTPLGLLQPEQVLEVISNAQGRVQALMRCNGSGPSKLLVALATGEQAEIAPPDCTPPPTTTVDPVAAPTPPRPSSPVVEAVPVPEASIPSTVIETPNTVIVASEPTTTALTSPNPVQVVP